VFAFWRNRRPVAVDLGDPIEEGKRDAIKAMKAANLTIMPSPDPRPVQWGQPPLRPGYRWPTKEEQRRS
jgi:hypothetical protein